jgi:branched-chain amino acid transport system ATP-binding protein
VTDAPLLKVRNLTKRYGGLLAVDDVSFDLAPHKITAIIGPNGAGKSTCFNLISGHTRPTGGTLAFAGNDITGIPDYRAARLGIARTFQSTALFRNLSVIDNVIVGTRQHARSTVVDAILRTPRHARKKRSAVSHSRSRLRVGRS